MVATTPEIGWFALAELSLKARVACVAYLKLNRSTKMHKSDRRPSEQLSSHTPAFLSHRVCQRCDHPKEGVDKGTLM